MRQIGCLGSIDADKVYAQPSGIPWCPSIEKAGCCRGDSCIDVAWRLEVGGSQGKLEKLTRGMTIAEWRWLAPAQQYVRCALYAAGARLRTPPWRSGPGQLGFSCAATGYGAVGGGPSLP